jgi:hypothetical protein
MVSFCKGIFLAHALFMQIGMCRAQLIDYGIMDQADFIMNKRSISMNLDGGDAASSKTSTLLQNEKNTVPLKISLVPLSLPPADRNIMDILDSNEGEFHTFHLQYVHSAHRTHAIVQVLDA